LPRRESSSLKRGYTRLGEENPGASVLFGVLSPRREIFRPSEEVFSPTREYFRPGESIFAQAKIDLALWTTFAQAINFSLRQGVFSSWRNWSRLSEKKFFFFWPFFSECLALLECNVCIY